MVNVIIGLTLLPFAVAWGAWLVVDAAITLPVRGWVMGRFGDDSPLTYLVHCVNCSSFWVSLLLSIPTCFMLRDRLSLWTAPLVVMAMAQLAPMVLSVANRLQWDGES